MDAPSSVPAPSVPTQTQTQAPPAADIGLAVTLVSAPAEPPSSPLASDLGLANPARYTVRGEVARGGFGVVLRADDQQIGREVALKQLIEPNPSVEARFIREALITARLEHPGIVPVHEVGRRADGSPYYAMKLLSGRSFKSVLAEATSFEERRLLIGHVIAVADAIAFAHSRRIIHRDLKPANIVVGDYGETVVVDWGLAKNLSEPDEQRPPAAMPYRTSGRAGDDLTAFGQILGTPAYMPPEQARGEEVDERADVYSLGAILYHVLAGDPPYRASSTEEILEKVRSEELTPIKERAPRAAEELVAIVQKAMARDAAARYPTASELAKDLRRYQAGQLVGAYAYSPLERAAKWVRRRRTLAAAVAAAFLVAVLGGVAAFVREQRLRHEEQRARQEAVASAAEARRRLLLQYVDQGRRLLLEDDVLRAAGWLTAARAGGLDTPALRFLAGEVSRPLGAIIARVDHGGWVSNINVSPDGERFLTIGDPEVVHIWRSADGALVRSLDHRGGAVAAGAFSPDGKQILTASRTGFVRVWDAATGALIRELPGSPGRTRIAWSPDGQRFVLGFESGELRIIDAASGNLSARSTVHGKRFYAVVFSPDGRRLITANADDTARVLDGRTAMPIAELTPADHVLALVFDPTGDRIATTSLDGKLRVWRSDSGALVRVIEGHTGAVRAVAWSPDGRFLATGGADAQARVVDAESGNLVATLTGHVNQVNNVRYNRDGTRLLTASEDGTTRLWDPVFGVEVALLAGHRASIEKAIYTPDGTKVITCGPDGAIVYSARDQHSGGLAREAGRLWWVAWSPDGNRLVTANDRPGVKVWDRSGRLLVELAGHKDAVTMARFSPDGTRLATVSFDGTGGIWEAASGRRIATLTGHGDRVVAVAWSPDGSFVVTGSYDKTARIWDAATGQLRHVLAAHINPVTTVAVDDRGIQVLTSGLDHKAILWDASSGRELASSVLLSDYVNTVAFDPRGRWLAVGAQDGRIHFLDPLTCAERWTLDNRARLLNMEIGGHGALVHFAGINESRIWDLQTMSLLLKVRRKRTDDLGEYGPSSLSPDGHHLAIVADQGFRIVDIGAAPEDEHGGLEAFTTLVACRVPYRLENERLVEVANDRLECGPRSAATP